MANKLEYRKKDAVKETRAIGELSEINEAGEFSGYITVWDTVDSYKSTFKRGAFKKTLQERGDKVKILYDHADLIGSAVSIVEDDHGLFGTGKLNMRSEKAKEIYTFMQDGTLDTLSFMFRTIKEHFEKGVRIIDEVQLYEFGPVKFEANEAAIITDVREDRSTDFQESLTMEELESESSQLKWALNVTLSDIWFDGTLDNTQVIGALDKALADFHAAYLDYAGRFLAMVVDEGFRHAPGASDLEKRFRDMLTDKNLKVEELAQQTTFTLDELNELRAGNMVGNREQLGSLSADIEQAHNTKRNEAVESLCSELRGKLTASEKLRIRSLLADVVASNEPVDYSDMLNYFKTEQSIGEKDNG